jgi:biotin carboxylase
MWLADEAVHIGPPAPAESYLNTAKIIWRQQTTGARRSIRATASCRRTLTSSRRSKLPG